MQQLPDRVAYLFGPFRLDPAGRRLLRDGEPVGLTAKVLDVLVALVEAQGAVVERDALMDRVWPATAVVDANLTQTVSVLRKALGDTAAEHRYVATVPGRGYQFTAPVETVRPPERGNRAAEAAPVAVAGASAAAGRPPWRLRTAGPGGRPQHRSTLLGALVVAVPIVLVLAAILMALAVGGDRTRRDATGSVAAHRELLVGRAHFLERTREGYEKAAAAFERALDRDPTYTPALANLALTHALMASNGNATESPRDLYIRALAEAQRAIERAPDLAEGHIALGLVKMNAEYDWAAAAAALRRAEALDPESVYSRYLLAIALMLAGDDDAAWREARSLARPRPGLPPAAELSERYSYGLLALFLGRAEEGRNALSRALAVGPDHGGVRMYFAIALDELGDHRQALSELDRGALQYWSSSQSTATLANYLGRSSDPQDRVRARQILADLEAEDEGSPGRTLSRAIAHAGAGSKAEAIRLLWQAEEERSVLPIFVQRDHRIDPLRGEPELQRLLVAMHLAPDHQPAGRRGS